MQSVLYLCGDIHGEFKTLLDWNTKVENANAIQVGDFGVGFRDPAEDQATLMEIGAALEERGNSIYVIRGNHDKPEWFDGRAYGGLVLVPDESVLSLNGKNLLCVGGAVSVDRTLRLEGRDWWANEKMNWEGDLPEERIHALITHAGGSWTGLKPESPYLSAWHAKDENLLADLRHEILQHDRLAEALLKAGHPLTRWYCGHYHLPLNNEVGGILCRGLEIDEFASWQWE